MAADARRAARRKRIMENSTDRLQRIVDNRSPGSQTHQRPLKSFSNTVPNITDNKRPINNDSDADGDGDHDHSQEESSASGGDENGLTTNEGSFQFHNERESPQIMPQNTDDAVKKSSTLAKEETRNSTRWTRVVVNAVLAVVLVGRWTYENETRQDTKALIIDVESFLWPFIALQGLLLCLPSFRQTSHSGWISMLKVTLQLCGIPMKLIDAVHFIVSSLLVVIADVPVFIFSTVVSKQVIELINRT